ncbi:MAG: hydantoinase B/oxoprolinase family protein [Candidatus Eisenbacteria bacterium]
MSARARRRDGVALALHQGLLTSCAEEMGAALMRAAHSPNITERLDHSCAIFDADARLVAQAAHIPVHLGSMPRAVEVARTLGPFAPGDVVLLNDPFAGGTHLPDLTLVSGVVLGARPGRAGARAGAGRAWPDFYVASRAHHADVGGAAPGSLPIAREVYEEGFRIPPVFLRRAGVMQDAVLALLLANVRTADERRADLAAQLGAQDTGERRLRELAARGERAAFLAATRALLDATEARARAAFAKLPRGTWRFADALDDDGLSDAPVPIRVALTLDGRGAVLDFSGSAPQAAGPVNAVLAVTKAASLYALRCVLGDDVAVNDGLLRTVRVVAPEGGVTNPLPPAAVGAGNVETSQRIVDVVFGALAQALPGVVPAASAGTMNNLLLGGRDPRTGRAFAYYETIGGGHGAGPHADGASAMQSHMTNTRNTSAEALEHACPVRVREYAVRRGSGGAGARRGGDGIVRALELLAPARVTVIAERRVRAPYGLAGGAPGKRGETVVRERTTASPRRMRGKFTVDLAKGAVLTVASPGGGGWGTPRRSRRSPRRG